MIFCTGRIFCKSFSTKILQKELEEVLENLIQYVDDFRVTRVRAPNIIDGAIKKLWSLGLDKIDFVFFVDLSSTPVIDQKISEKM